MNAADMVAAVRALGVVVSECDGRVRVHPTSRVTQELKALVKQHRPDIIAYLVAVRDADRSWCFGTTVPLTGELVEPSRCYTCDGARWWRLRTGMHRVCGVCHPPAVDPADVVWLEAEGGDHAP